jgi:hypothetical protein
MKLVSIPITVGNQSTCVHTQIPADEGGNIRAMDDGPSGKEDRERFFTHMVPYLSDMYYQELVRITEADKEATRKMNAVCKIERQAALAFVEDVRRSRVGADRGRLNVLDSEIAETLTSRAIAEGTLRALAEAAVHNPPLWAIMWAKILAVVQSLKGKK